MTDFNLNGLRFSPVSNSDGGRVNKDAVFHYSQTDVEFEAHYGGSGFSDGHLIGRFTDDTHADLVYHCREDATHALEVGQAKATFTRDAEGLIHIHMDWQWLNLSKSSGQSHYVEVP